MASEDGMEPATLTVKTRTGIDRVVVDFDQGHEAAAFDLLRDALPALRELDRLVRRSQQSRATDTEASRPRTA